MYMYMYMQYSFLCTRSFYVSASTEIPRGELRLGVGNPWAPCISYKYMYHCWYIYCSLPQGDEPEKMVSGSDDFTLFLWNPAESKKHIERMTGKHVHACICMHVTFLVVTYIMYILDIV